MIDQRVNKIASLANKAVYDSQSSQKYIDGAPHIKHSMLRSLYGELVVTIYDFAATYTNTPTLLDMGAGEGSVTLPFLELGAKVTAIDISENRLKALQEKCANYSGNLEVTCQNVFDAIKSIQLKGRQYDIIVANSFLHHIPDYLELIREAAVVLSPHGQFFSFQEPVQYDSMGRFTIIFSTLAYLSWRTLKGDIIGGLKRRIRRSSGVYLNDCHYDYADYHAIRDGVNQNAIFELFKELGFECIIMCYFSTQSCIWQRIGTALGIENTFAVIARRSPYTNQLGVRTSMSSLLNLREFDDTPIEKTVTIKFTKD
jgi:2-polyprenyl-3-methyl-5-hydroxy-6-metoxy-1,4-benzoquinol methylase